MKIMKLTRGMHTIVDDDDYAKFGHLKFFSKRSTTKDYAVRSVAKGKCQRLHNLIMCPPEGLIVDHKNGDGLDNRRANLRIVTRSQNTLYGCRNKTSSLRNVQYKARRGVWEVNIRVGQYASEAAAGIAAEAARQKLGIT